ncbi:MAG: LysM peptidoglycan-binding domain-containing protein, partial [Rikenellaceae bacterium]
GSAVPMSEGWFADAENLTTEGVDPNNFATTINGHKGYNVYRNNGVFFVVAKSGDSYDRIADFFKLSKRRLLAYNDLTRKAQLKMGDVVYIARKQSRYKNGSVTEHVVKSGESVQSVSQEYAIMESSLRRINKLSKGAEVTPGQTLKLK